MAKRGRPPKPTGENLSKPHKGAHKGKHLGIWLDASIHATMAAYSDKHPLNPDYKAIIQEALRRYFKEEGFPLVVIDEAEPKCPHCGKPAE